MTRLSREFKIFLNVSIVQTNMIIYALSSGTQTSQAYSHLERLWFGWEGLYHTVPLLVSLSSVPPKI